MNRRQFLQLSAGLASLLPASSLLARSRRAASAYFGVHPFIESNPEAVFIMRTSVDSKYNKVAKEQAGGLFARSVFVAKGELDGHAFPIDTLIAMKPNLTSYSANAAADLKMGIVTDPSFMEGLIEGMKPLGLAGSQFHIREVNGEDLQGDNGYAAMVNRTGANLFVKGTKVTRMDSSLIVWKDVPNGIYFTKIPYLWPVNAPNTFLLNIAKFKAHGMGLTLAAKNLQGSIAANYQAHCTSFTTNLDMNADHRNPDAADLIEDNFRRHRADGVPRWDKPGNSWNCGHGMEAWASRCLDNNSVTRPELHIIEGIYGHDGNFTSGPHNGEPKDFMSNIIVFGKNPFHVDAIGLWLGGHEPGNFGLLHMALERGMSALLNPHDIPVYEWSSDGSATLTPLDSFARTPLLTYYLQRDYDGQEEDYWHLVNEPFDYSSVRVERPAFAPFTFDLGQNYPNPFNSSTVIDFTLPRPGHVQVSVHNAFGQTVAVLHNGYAGGGHHMLTWRAHDAPSGAYFYRCQFEGYAKSGRMLLIR